MAATRDARHPHVPPASTDSQARRAALARLLVADLARIAHIENLRAAWRAASDDEDCVLCAYDDGEATLADVEAANARMNAAWWAYKEALDEAATELVRRRAARSSGSPGGDR